MSKNTGKERIGSSRRAGQPRRGRPAAPAAAPAPKAPDFVWAVVELGWDGERTFVVVRRSTFEHWMERLPVLGCRTWGELRRTVTPEVFDEVCELCGYGSFGGYTRHLAITGAVPLPGVRDQAVASYDPEAEIPDDDAAFDVERDVGAYGDGDWPPAVAYLMNEDLPQEILDAYAEVTMTVLNGAYAEIPVKHRRAVLRELAALGYAVAEEKRLEELVNCRM